ncbi:hypothetical protein B0H14DRAFT_2627435 [Mycena olivaceomarginata]|nr:hypothetical protein B0H14DRAFT_2627435 [Mycena olivaceomarginata]
MAHMRASIHLGRWWESTLSVKGKLLVISTNIWESSSPRLNPGESSSLLRARVIWNTGNRIPFIVTAAGDERAEHARAADEEVQAAEQAVTDAQAQLKQIWAESKMITALPRILVANALRLKVCFVIPLENASTSVDNGTVPDEMIPGVTTSLGYLLKTYHELELWQLQPSLPSEYATRPVRKRSGYTSLESDVPPKRLKHGPLKGWGIERDGVDMIAVEYAEPLERIP